MFEDLELPDLERKKLREIAAQRLTKRKGYRTVGIRVRLDKRRTVKAKVRRRLATRHTSEHFPDDRKRFPFHDDDLIYRHMVTDTRKESNAVVLCIMDTSGSMDTMKKYLARSFFFLLYQFIRTKYRNVEIVFIAHHTEAHEVSEEEFFHKGESGGTFISSGYQKALEIIAGALPPVAVERLRLPLLRRRQLRLRQPGGAARRQGARRGLQPVRLRRDQAARARATTRARCSTSSAASTPTTSRPC